MKLKYSLSQFTSDGYNHARVEQMIINLQKQVDMLYELADLGFEDGNPGLTHADYERIETLLAARKEVIEDE